MQLLHPLIQLCNCETYFPWNVRELLYIFVTPQKVWILRDASDLQMIKKFMGWNVKKSFFIARTLYLMIHQPPIPFLFFFVKSQDFWYHICAKVFISIGSFSQKFCLRQTCKLPSEECLLLFDGLVINMSSKRTTNRRYDVQSNEYWNIEIKCFWYSV